jgi:hypothetical protein
MINVSILLKGFKNSPPTGGAGGGFLFDENYQNRNL